MNWSISEAKTFRRCQRQWFFAHRLAAAQAKKDLLKREAWILRSFQTIQEWRGQVVDTMMKKVVVPALNSRLPLSLHQLRFEADRIIDRQLAFARANRVREPGMKKTDNLDFAALRSVEETGAIDEAVVQVAREEIHLALATFAKNRSLREALRKARLVIANDRAYYFDVGPVRVKAVPDLVAFYQDRPPLIIDWKVHFFGVHDARVQLLIYAMALARSGKTGGGRQQWGETEIKTAEVQLLTGVVRGFKLTPENAVEMENYILSSYRDITRATEGRSRDDLKADDLEPTSYADACEKCNFRKICLN